MFDGGESLPLAGEEKTTLSDDPEPTKYTPSGKVVRLENPTRYVGRIKHCENRPKC